MENKRDPATVVISGASTGIGHATALLLDRRGYQVFAGVRKAADAERLRGEASARMRVLTLDITRPEQIAAARATVDEAVGERGLTCLINNAGVCVAGPVEFLPLDELRRQLEVNLIGHVAMTQAFLPAVRRGHGRIINVASANGRFAFPCFGAYAASKFGVEGISDSLRRELRSSGIPVIVIEPGTVEAAIWDRTGEATVERQNQIASTEKELYGELGRRMDVLMNKGRRCAFQPEAIAAIMLKALEARRPRARYRGGPGSKMAVLGSRLPEAISDWFVDQVIHERIPSKLLGW